jgi:hypothetical protein
MPWSSPLRFGCDQVTVAENDINKSNEPQNMLAFSLQRFFSKNGNVHMTTCKKLYGAMAYVEMQPSLMNISSVASSHKSMCYGVIARDG